jgi:ornithine cyclodeaminase/alanine dehydrogenase-like protein (mu-crystallin family)
VPVGADEVVLVESQGLAIEDLLCALHVIEAVEAS